MCLPSVVILPSGAIFNLQPSSFPVHSLIIGVHDSINLLDSEGLKLQEDVPMVLNILFFLY